MRIQSARLEYLVADTGALANDRTHYLVTRTYTFDDGTYEKESIAKFDDLDSAVTYTKWCNEQACEGTEYTYTEA